MCGESAEMQQPISLIKPVPTCFCTLTPELQILSLRPNALEKLHISRQAVESAYADACNKQ